MLRWSRRNLTVPPAKSIPVVFLQLGKPVKIEEEQDRTKQIDEEKEYMQTDEYVAEIARDRLGLVKSNEIVFEEEK